MEQLSKNFSLDEFLVSQKAKENNIDNTPSGEVIENLRKLVLNILQPLRDKFGQVGITSGYRSPALNAAVGGAKDSQHQYGMAADIHVPGMGNDKLAEYIRDNFDFDQVILEFHTAGNPSSGWVHVSYNAPHNRKESLTAVKQDGKTVYLKGIIL